MSEERSILGLILVLVSNVHIAMVLHVLCAFEKGSINSEIVSNVHIALVLSVLKVSKEHYINYANMSHFFHITLLSMF